MFTFIESAAFERVRAVYLDDGEYAELQQFMMQNAEAGNIVRGSGGVRKLRWRREGTGKRGGVRVIYFVRHQPDVLDAGLVCQSQAGERACPYSQATKGGVPT